MCENTLQFVVTASVHCGIYIQRVYICMLLVCSAMSALAVIQGPPGTGKTRTILALLSVIMHSAPPGSGKLLKGSTAPKAQTYISEQQQETLWKLSSPWLIEANPR